MNNSSTKIKFSSLLMLIVTMFFGFNCVQAQDNKLPELTIYTYDSFMSEWGPGPKIKTDFEKDCNCKLNFKVFEDGVSLLTRLKLEGKKTKADIILGLDNNLLYEAKTSKLLAKHNLTKAIAQKLQNMPIKWTDEYFIPYDYGYFAFVYNKEKLKNPPKSLDELANRKDITLLYQDPRSSTPGLGLLLWIKNIYKDKAADIWQKISKKTIVVSKGWSESYSLFLQGEADMVLSYTTSPVYHMIYEKDFRFASADFSEGHYMQIETLAKTIKAKNNKLADKFMLFALSEKFQTNILSNIMYPVAKIVMPKEYNNLIKPKKVLVLESEYVYKNRQLWIKEWLNAYDKK